MADVVPDNMKHYYPAPFPEDLPTIQLESVRIQDLLNPSDEIKNTVFRVLCNEGFLYVDLRSDPDGQDMVRLSEQLHDAAIDIFNNVPVSTKEEEWKGNALQGILDKGYRAMGKDATGQPRVSEVLNVPAYELTHDPNFQLPSWLEKYRGTYKSFAEHGHRIAQALLAILDSSLHLKKGTLTGIHERSSGAAGGYVRMFRAPAPFTNGDEHVTTTTSTPAHTDGNSITILFNWQGGLQIAKPTNDAAGRAVEMIDKYDRLQDEWLWVNPKPGHVIINLGDSLVALTNGVLAASRHRVVTPPGLQSAHHRYSVLTGVRARNDTPMRALESDMIPPETEEQKAGDTVTALEYSVNKVRAIIERTDQTRV